MELKKALHMNLGNGETSYANNSVLQRIGISKTWLVLDDSLRNMSNWFQKCFKIADFGCASGPNTLVVISHITDTMEELCRKDNPCGQLPEIQENNASHDQRRHSFSVARLAPSMAGYFLPIACILPIHRTVSCGSPRSLEV